MKLIRKATLVFDRTVSLLAVLGAVLIFLIVAAVSISVIARYFLGIAWMGLVEISAMSLLFITFLGTTWVLRKDGHTTMDILIKQLNPKGEALINMLTSILCALICLVIVWYGTQVTWARFLKGTYLFSHLNIPDAYFLFIIPVGSFFLFVQFLRRANRYLHAWRYARVPETKGVE